MAKLKSERVKYPRPTELIQIIKYCALVTVIEDGRLDFLKHYRIKNKVFFCESTLPIHRAHVIAIRDVFSIYGDHLTNDEDGFDEIQNNMNDCEWAS